MKPRPASKASSQRSAILLFGLLYRCANTQREIISSLISTPSSLSPTGLPFVRVALQVRCVRHVAQLQGGAWCCYGSPRSPFWPNAHTNENWFSSHHAGVFQRLVSYQVTLLLTSRCPRWTQRFAESPTAALPNSCFSFKEKQFLRGSDSPRKENLHLAV